MDLEVSKSGETTDGQAQRAAKNVERGRSGRDQSRMVATRHDARGAAREPDGGTLTLFCR